MCCIVVMLATAHADIYFVPPPVQRIILVPDHPVVAVNASALRVFPAQRAYVQLAVIGKPSPEPVPSQGSSLLVKPGVEDPTPMPIRAFSHVTLDDIRSARALLEQAGISAEAITERQAGNGPGQILVAIDRAAPRESQLVIAKVSSAIARYPQIVPAGTVVLRADCNAEASVAALAREQGRATATLFARAAGFSAGPVLSDVQWYADAYDPRLHVVCGSITPKLAEYAGFPEDLHARAYPVSVHRALTLSLQPAPHARPLQIAGSTHTAYVENHVVAQQLIVPDDEPFVSAQGQAHVQVTPAGFVGVFRVAPGSQQPGSVVVKELAAAVQSAGIKRRDMLATNEAIFVKVPTQTALASLWKYTAKPPLSGSFEFTADPFVPDCDGIRSRVIAAALAGARARAQTMAAQAHARIGGMLAIVDAGQTIGALCGYGGTASIRRLALAAQSLDPVWPAGAGATFGSALVAAWRMGLPRAPRAQTWPDLAPAYAFNSTIDEAFTTRGAGVLGRAFEPQVDCRQAHLTVLAAAARDAVRGAGSKPIQALIDQGETRETWSSPNCTQRVLAVIGE